MASTNVPNGHDHRGKFAPGNKFGRGNPWANRVAAYRKAFHEAVSDADLQDIVRTLVRSAREGDVAAAKLVLQYCLGNVAEPVQETAEDEQVDIIDVQDYLDAHQN